MNSLRRLMLAMVILPVYAVVAPVLPAVAAVGDTDTTFSLNGTTTAAQIADANSLDISDAITIEAWVKPTGASGSNAYIVVNKESAYELYQSGGNWIYALAHGGSWNGVNTSIPVRNDEWQHVAMTRAASTATVNFYFNGKLAYTGSADGAGTSTIDNTAYPLTIGGRSTSFGSGISTFFKGEIDEVRLFKSARTASEIATDMHSYGPVSDTNLVEYLDFNDVSGTTIANKATGSSASGNLTTYGTTSFPTVSTTTTVSGDTVVTFPRDYLTANGGWKAPVGITNARTLIVAGGGGGGSGQYGYAAGGGGGGQVIESSISLSDNTFYPIRVGVGGTGSLSYNTAGNNGDTSTAFSISASGGGGGGSGILSSNFAGAAPTAGYTGGGGGANWIVNTTYSTGATATYTGGDARTDTNYVDGQSGGGGGGAGGNGGSATTTGSGASIVAAGGNGGSGISSTLQTGSANTYGGGGGGGKRTGTSGKTGNGVDGGGNGSLGSAAGNDAAVNRGGGGGGAASYASNDTNYNGGKGGSGIVILRYGINYTTSTSITIAAGAMTYRSAKNISVTVTKPGKVDLKANGKYIPGCRSLVANSANSLTVTCSFKPAVHSLITINAFFSPTDGTYSSSTSVTAPVISTKRVGSR